MAANITANAAYHFGLDEAAYTFCTMIARPYAGAAAQPAYGLPSGYAAPEGFTALDIPLQVGPLLCESVAGLLPSAFATNIGLETSGIEATFVFEKIGGLNRDLVEAGAYLGSWVDVFAVPWQALLSGEATAADIVPLLRGRFGGSPDLTDEQATFELLPISAVVNNMVGRTTGEFCDVKRFGGGRCTNLTLRDGVDIKLHGRTIAGTVVEAPAGQTSYGMRLWLELDESRATGWADHGVLRMAGGEMEGAEFAVKRWAANGEILLRTPVGIVPEPGTRVYLEEGCDRTLKTCITKEPNPSAPTGRGNIANNQSFDSPGDLKFAKQKKGSTPAKILEAAN